MAHKLVIVESPAKARGSGASSARAMSSSPRSATSATCPNSAADTREDQGQPWGRLAVDVENGFEPYYVVPRDKKATRLQAQGPPQGRRRALPRHRRGPRGRGDRLAPARRAQAQQHRGQADGVPADDQAGDPGRCPEPARHRRWTSSRPRRRAGSSTASTATSSRRSSGRRSCPACPRAVSSPSPPASSSTASATGWEFRVCALLGPRGHLRRRPKHDQRMFPAKLDSVTALCVARGVRLRPPTASSRGRPRAKVVDLDRTQAEALVGGTARTRRTTSARWSRSPTVSRRTRRSGPPPSSRRRAASSASRPP